MIPADIEEWIFPYVADGSADAAILQHDCGVSFQFRVESEDKEYVISEDHLKSWRTKIEKVAACAGHSCFSYNTLEADPEGVYHDQDGNVFAILFAPETFLEHNDVDGWPMLLVISEDECILTGSDSDDGAMLLENYLEPALASKVVVIDDCWEQWVSREVLISKAKRK